MTITRSEYVNTSSFTTSSTSYVDITSATITLQSTGTAFLTVDFTIYHSSVRSPTVALLDDGTIVDEIQLGTTTNTNYVPSSLFWAMTSNSSVMKLQIKSSGTGTLYYRAYSVYNAVEFDIAGATTETKTFTLDLVIEEVQTKTFTLDLVVEEVQTKTFTLDLVIQEVQTKTFTLDLVIQETQTKTFTLDLVVQETQTKTFTIDLVIEEIQTTTFTLDLVVLEIQTTTFTLDLVIQEVQTTTFTLDLAIQDTGTTTFTLDLVVQEIQTQTFTLDLVIQETQTVTFTLDLVIQEVQTTTFTLDLAVSEIQTTTFTIDLVIQEVQTQTFTLDLYIEEMSTSNQTFTLDLVIQDVGTTTFTLDLAIQDVATKTFTLDLVIQEVQTQTFTLDLVVQDTATKTFTLDLVIQESATTTFTLDLVVQEIQTTTFTLDLVVEEIQTTTFTLDLAISEIQTTTFTLDLVIESVVTNTFTIDLVIQESQTTTFTLDLVTSSGVSWSIGRGKRYILDTRSDIPEKKKFQRPEFILSEESIEWTIDYSVKIPPQEIFHVPIDFVLQRTLDEVVPSNIQFAIPTPESVQIKLGFDITVQEKSDLTHYLKHDTDETSKHSLDFTYPINHKMMTIKLAKGILRNKIAGSVRAKQARIVLTTTNKELDKVINSFENSMKPIMQGLIDSKKPVEELEESYSNQIMEIVTRQVTKSYMVGLDYVEKAVGEKTVLTSDDELRIRLLSKQIYSSVWHSVHRGRKEAQKNLHIIVGSSVFDFLRQLGGFFTAQAVNQATIAGVRQVNSGLGFTQYEQVYEFVTMRDDKVDCRICKPLDGLLMKPSSIFFAQPPLHFGCRCRLLIRLRRSTMSG